MNFMDIIDSLSFLPKFIQTLISEELKWNSNLFKLFPNNSDPQHRLKNTMGRSLVDCQIKFLHEFCFNQPDSKIIIIDLDDNFNCTILGQLDPLTDESSQKVFPMILLRRMTQTAEPESLLLQIPEFYHVPTSKLIEMKIQNKFLYFFNKLQYVRMKALISNGISEDIFQNWRFDESGSESDKIKEILDMHFAEAAEVSTPKISTKKVTNQIDQIDAKQEPFAEARTPKTPTSSSTPSTTTSTGASRSLTSAASSLFKEKAKSKMITESVIETPCNNITDKVDDDDEDEIVFRRPGRKRKQPKFEVESSLQRKKKVKMQVLLANVTYECHMPQCRKKFNSWVQFEKHQNDHDTQCKYCYKIFNNRKGLETHMIYFAEDHKPKSKIFECKICYREFVNEAVYKCHVESVHPKKEWMNLAKDLESKLKEKRKKKFAIKSESDETQQSPNKSPEPVEPTAEVIEISDDEDGEVVCKSNCGCVICKGSEVRFCK